jgi:HPt (histidine-containing phosphotransfer) domain-containing protein
MISHTLKSSSSQVGASSLVELCRTVENDALNQNYDTSSEALIAIQQAFAQVRIALKAYLDSSSINTGIY